jgi:hypothetical protein
MKKGLVAVIVVGLVVGFVLVGCGPKKAGSSSEAISASKAMETVKEKTDYLIAQAKTFYNSKDFQGAIDIAQNVLSTLDKDSAAAKDLLAKAKSALEAKAKSAVEDVKGALGGFGN